MLSNTGILLFSATTPIPNVRHRMLSNTGILLLERAKSGKVMSYRIPINAPICPLNKEDGHYSVSYRIPINAPICPLYLSLFLSVSVWCPLKDILTLMPLCYFSVSAYDHPQRRHTLHHYKYHYVS